ncbi:MAG: chorismate synthase, partial [Planctomycetota bacterium]|nr:chorismate synthase [Planctomycetota bacterium]
MNSFGKDYRTTIFGSSHGSGVGCVIEGVPAGTSLNLEAIQGELDRRRPGQSALTTQRKEGDRLEMQEGMLEDRATGSPLVFWVKNRDVDSSSYETYRRIPRPGHADYPARMKYAGYNDYRGGGQFSGRMTIPLVISGALARQILSKGGIEFYAHAVQVGSVRLEETLSVEEIRAGVESSPVRCAEPETARSMVQEVEAARKAGDSVGGVIECIVTGLPVGVGEPFYDSVESEISHLCFAVPAVKGIEFGSGFAAAGMRGSEHNDPYAISEGRVITETNNAGGIQGGLTNGMPVVFRVAIKPTSSITKLQKSVDLDEMEPAELRVTGRHDPCIVPRAVPVIENAAAAPLLDLMIRAGFL